jgi:hypothetical protein
MAIEYDEAYVKGEEEHAKRRARAMIAEHLLQYADDHRTHHLEGDAIHYESERPMALAIDLVRPELEVWLQEGKQ